MIRALFQDDEDSDSIQVVYTRKELKYDPMKRMLFAGEVNHAIAHYIGKLRKEVKEENK